MYMYRASPMDPTGVYVAWIWTPHDAIVVNEGQA